MFSRAKTVKEVFDKFGLSETGENQIVVVPEFAPLLKERITEVADLLTELAKDGDAAGVSVVAEALDRLITRYQTLYHFR